MSEDCLYLSVTTGAASADEKRPVYVWFHGGGLNAGYYFETEFDGNELAKKGIVVVSVGQRLNVFGYLSLPQLTEEQGKSGNYGFMDQIEALKWVRENIAAFGGDPENITIGGQSGGSQKCCLLAGSPASNHLFRRCILHSGLKWLQRFPSLQEAETEGTEFLKACGIDPDISLNELRLLPPTSFRPKNGAARIPAGMVCDGELVPYPLMKDALLKYAGGIDFICGTCLGEGDVFADMEGTAEKQPFTDKEAFYAHFKALLKERYETSGFEQLVPVTDETAWLTARTLTTQGLARPGRVNFSRNLMAARLFAKRMKEEYPAFRAYAFLFSHLLPMRAKDRGTAYDSELQLAYHSSDLFYAFASLREGQPPTRPWTEADFRLANEMSTYLANFMRTGIPDGAGLLHSEEAEDGTGLLHWGEASDGSYLEFSDRPVPHDGMSGPLDELIREYVKEAYAF